MRKITRSSADSMVIAIPVILFFMSVLGYICFDSFTGGGDEKITEFGRKFAPWCLLFLTILLLHAIYRTADPIIYSTEVSPDQVAVFDSRHTTSKLLICKADVLKFYIAVHRSGQGQSRTSTSTVEAKLKNEKRSIIISRMHLYGKSRDEFFEAIGQLWGDEYLP
jgi:hypothetical protein